MKMLVIDGNSILNRAFYGIRPLTTKDGQHTNAIFGFMTTFEKVLSETNPDAVAVAFDMKAPTFRAAESAYNKSQHAAADTEYNHARRSCRSCRIISRHKHRTEQQSARTKLQ